MRSFARWVRPTFRYWMQTEVHVFAFSVAANVLLSFYPFLIVMMWLSRSVFGDATTVAAIDALLRAYFPDAVAQFLHSKEHQNLPKLGGLQLTSIALLLFTANGIFEPLEIGLNHVWGIAKNRSFFRNQLISLGLIFACGGMALISVLLTGLHSKSLTSPADEAAGISTVFLKLVALPLSALSLVLIYRYLPNGRPPMMRVLPAAIVVGILLEVLKYVNALVWPWFYTKLEREYGVFKNSVSLILIGFLGAMLVLAGAEWSARGHRMDQLRIDPAEEKPAEPKPVEATPSA